MTRKGQYLVIRRGTMQEDSWSYGDWRQYIVFRDNGDACCVRLSRLPFFAALVGIVALCFPALALFAWWHGVEVVWDQVWWYTFVAFALIGPAAVQSLTPWRLVKVVLTCTRNEHGWSRDL